MFCLNCGVETANDVKFCSNCGANIAVEGLEPSKVANSEREIRVMFEGYWGIPAKKGAVICLDDKIVLKPRGFDFLLGTSLAGAAVNSMLKQHDANFHLFDANNEVISVGDIEEIVLKRKKIGRDLVTIVMRDGKGKTSFYAQKVPEMFQTLYSGLVR